MSVPLSIIGPFQSGTTWLITRYLTWRWSIDVSIPFSFEHNTRYLFVANHQSRLDPFAVFAALSYRQLKQITPTRFMTAGAIYYSALRPFLSLCGCYPTRKKNDSAYDTVEQSIHFLEHQQNVFIFPEGRRTLQAESQPRSGVKRIFDGTSIPITVILIHLEWTIEKKHRSLKVVFSQTDLINSAGSLMEQIYRL